MAISNPFHVNVGNQNPTKPTSNPFHYVGQPDPNAPPTSNAFGNLGIEGSGFATRDVVPTPEAAPVVTPPPPDYDSLLLNDPERQRQQGYLDLQNTQTTEALRKAWLMHTQSTQDSFNAHGMLFSGAQQQARENGKDAYNAQSAIQALAYDKGGHDLNTSVMHRLIKVMSGVDDGMGTTT